MIWRHPLNYEVLQIQTKTNTSLTFSAGTTKAWIAGAAILPMRQALAGSDTMNGASISTDVRVMNSIWNIKVEDSSKNSRVQFSNCSNLGEF